MAAMKPYTIIVETAITRADGREFWRDVMTWTGVDEDTRLWLAGSCKTALFRLVGVPEVAAGPSYTLAYRTLVMEGAGLSATPRWLSSRGCPTRVLSPSNSGPWTSYGRCTAC